MPKRETLTEAEALDLDRVIHYALGTQFGEVPKKGRKNAVKNVLRMHIEDLITERVHGVPDHVARKS